jgi:glycine cleavage system aminomethyltransferase T
MKATREAAGIFDQTSFAKLLLEGRDASAALNHICGANIDVEVGRSVYTGLFNTRGGYESDLTVMRLAADKFLIVSGSAQPVRDFDWISRHIPEGAHAVLTDVTSAWSVLGLMGPNSREISVAHHQCRSLR